MESTMPVPQAIHSSTWIVSPAQAQHLRGEAFARGIEIVRGWIARRRQLRALAALDDRLLADIGVSRQAAEREIARTFWMTYARRHTK
jgi:uncharacterized protein YjiS (DUF1127 family)